MPYEQQLAKKEEHLKQQLAKLDCDNLIWHPPFYSSESAFRNKAKMVVSGAVERPILGILQDPNDPQSAVDLCDCPLYPQRFAELFPILKDFIGRAGLVPYNVAKQKGELKYILLTESQHTKKIDVAFCIAFRKLKFAVNSNVNLQVYWKKLPQLEVVSVNIQPNHAAILEGEKESF